MDTVEFFMVRGHRFIHRGIHCLSYFERIFWNRIKLEEDIDFMDAALAGLARYVRIFRAAYEFFCHGDTSRACAELEQCID